MTHLIKVAHCTCSEEQLKPWCNKKVNISENLLGQFQKFQKGTQVIDLESPFQTWSA